MSVALALAAVEATRREMQTSMDAGDVRAVATVAASARALTIRPAEEHVASGAGRVDAEKTMVCLAVGLATVGAIAAAATAVAATALSGRGVAGGASDHEEGGEVLLGVAITLLSIATVATGAALCAFCQVARRSWRAPARSASVAAPLRPL